MKIEPITLAVAHRHVQQAWRRYMLPTYTSRDKATLLVALVVANAGLDELLLAEGHQGETPAERLRSARHSFSDYAGLRAARRVRDQAVHQLGYPLCRRMALPALAMYALALREHSVKLCERDHNAAPGSLLAFSAEPQARVGGQANGGQK